MHIRPSDNIQFRLTGEKIGVNLLGTCVKEDYGDGSEEYGLVKVSSKRKPTSADDVPAKVSSKRKPTSADNVPAKKQKLVYEYVKMKLPQDDDDEDPGKLDRSAVKGRAQKRDRNLEVK